MLIDANDVNSGSEKFKILFCYFGKKSMQFHLTKYNFC